MWEYFGLGWMTVEVVGSIGIGLLSGSLALLAFGGDSLIEIISGLAVTLHLRRDSSGSSGIGEGTERLTKFLLVSLIPIIGGDAVYSYLGGIKPESSLLGIAVALGAVIIMPILWVQKKRIGRETNCAPLSIDAVQSATCFHRSAWGFAYQLYLRHRLGGLSRHSRHSSLCCKGEQRRVTQEIRGEESLKKYPVLQ